MPSEPSTSALPTVEGRQHGDVVPAARSLKRRRLSYDAHGPSYLQRRQDNETPDWDAIGTLCLFAHWARILGSLGLNAFFSSSSCSGRMRDCRQWRRVMLSHFRYHFLSKLLGYLCLCVLLVALLTRVNPHHPHQSFSREFEAALIRADGFCKYLPVPCRVAGADVRLPRRTESVVWHSGCS